MKLREQMELADKKLEKLGFDSVDKAIIFCLLSQMKKINWLFSADKVEINEWYNRVQLYEKMSLI